LLRLGTNDKEKSKNWSTDIKILLFNSYYKKP